MTLLADGVTLADKQAINRALLTSGATITETNAVRKHLSTVKGGRLAAVARPARVVTLAISDIPGDELAAVASGPTLLGVSTLADVREIVIRRSIILSPTATAAPKAGVEAPKPKKLDSDVLLTAAPGLAFGAAAEVACQVGVTPLILGSIEGESRDLGIVTAGIARSALTNGLPVGAPAALLSGGQTTSPASRLR